jgi:hypothetical protein
MDRRHFLRTTFAGGLGATVAGCATTKGAGSDQPAMSEAALRDYLAQVDRSAQGIGSIDSAGAEGSDASMSRRRRARAGGSGEVDEQLIRSSMRTMLVSSSIAVLPEEGREHAESRRRLKAISAESDFAVSGTMYAMDSMGAAEFTAFDEDLKANPDYIDDVVRQLDHYAVETGVSKARRKHLKRMARHVAWRLKNQGSERVIRRTVRQVDRHLERIAKHPKFAERAIAADPHVAEYWREWTLTAAARYEGGGPPIQRPSSGPSTAGPEP